MKMRRSIRIVAMVWHARQSNPRKLFRCARSDLGLAIRGRPAKLVIVYTDRSRNRAAGGLTVAADSVKAPWERWAMERASASGIPARPADASSAQGKRKPLNDRLIALAISVV